MTGVQTCALPISIHMREIDLVMTGRNGDSRGDAVYDHLDNTLFQDKTMIPYKHYCGEYPTSISFAMWMAAHFLKSGEFPFENIPGKMPVSRPSRILIYNQYQNIHHSLLLHIFFRSVPIPSFGSGLMSFSNLVILTHTHSR